MHCKNGTWTAFQIRHSSLDVRLHFVCGKGSDAMPPLPACMEHVSTPISQGTSWFWNEKEYEVLLLVSSQLFRFRVPQQRYQACQNVQRSECGTVPSQAVACGTCLFMLHACPHTLFPIRYSQWRVYFDTLHFLCLAILRALVPIPSCCSQMVWMNCVRYRHQVRARGCPS